MRWGSILGKYPIITINNFFCSRKQFYKQMSAIVFFVNFGIIFVYKKRVITPYHEIAADTMFLDILFVELSKFSSGISFLYQIHDRSSVELQEWNLFQLVKRFFDHANDTFKSFSKGASAGFSSVSSTFTHLWCFQVFELFKVYFFHHSPLWWPTDCCLFSDFSRC